METLSARHHLANYTLVATVQLKLS
ncbi:Protein of unknown function [Bacillus mycoides]|nr:Protein of unknown function [Bacillus mycoides]